MKRIGVFLGCVFITAYLFPQDMVKNGRVPLNPKGGRVLNIEEVLRIEGEGEGWYHNGASGLDVDRDGNIYIQDAWSSDIPMHFLKFSSDGRFIRDLYKQGEGPGEISDYYEFALGDDVIYVCDGTKQKLILMTMDGELIKEQKLESGRISEFMGFYGGQLVIVWDEYPVERKKSGMYDILHHVSLFSQDGKETKHLLTLSHQQFFIAFGLGGGGRSWASRIIKMQGSEIATCTTCEYLVDVYDLETGKSVVRFNRKYQRIKHEQNDREKEFVKKYNAPKRKYENDIRDLFPDGDFIWVETSTVDEEKGKLFDLFDDQGRFLDSFFIPIEGQIVKISGDAVFSTEQNAEGLPVIVKYQIRESIGFK
ncbi:MAG: 6-bladed beta-propeller [Acidobacteriota bacterium]